MLELERMKQLDLKALIIQRVLRGYKHRYNAKRVSALLMQIPEFSLSHHPQERIPEEKSKRCRHSEILERTQKQEAAPSGKYF